jgi:hypothetical protein
MELPKTGQFTGRRSKLVCFFRSSGFWSDGSVFVSRHPFGIRQVTSSHLRSGFKLPRQSFSENVLQLMYIFMSSRNKDPALNCHNISGRQTMSDKSKAGLFRQQQSCSTNCPIVACRLHTSTAGGTCTKTFPSANSG